MPIVASEGAKGPKYVVPAEMHNAVCFAVFDLGLQKGEWQGKPIVQHKIIVGWEVEATIPEGTYKGKRYTIWKEYTLSLGEKANLTRDLTSWRGRAFTDEEKAGFDVEKLIGVPCVLSVVHTEKGNAKVGAIIKHSKIYTPLTPENTSELPEWIKKKQMAAVQPEVVDDEPAEVVEDDEGIPF